MSGRALRLHRAYQKKDPWLSWLDLPDFDWTRSSTVERFVYIEDVGGSNPSGSTKSIQAERLVYIEEVIGYSPERSEGFNSYRVHFGAIFIFFLPFFSIIIIMIIIIILKLCPSTLNLFPNFLNPVFAI